MTMTKPRSSTKQNTSTRLWTSDFSAETGRSIKIQVSQLLVKQKQGGSLFEKKDKTSLTLNIST